MLMNNLDPEVAENPGPNSWCTAASVAPRAIGIATDRIVENAEKP